MSDTLQRAMAGFAQLSADLAHLLRELGRAFDAGFLCAARGSRIGPPRGRFALAIQ